MTGTTISPAILAGGGRKATALPNLWVDINGQTKCSLTDPNIDAKLKTADQLLGYNEKMERDVDAASVNNLFAAGELMAGIVSIRLLRSDVVPYMEQMMASGKNIAKITIYRTAIIEGKMAITDEFIYENCYITKYDSYMGQQSTQDSIMGLDTAEFSFRYLKRSHNQNIYDQKGASQGVKASQIDFETGALGTAGGAAAGGGAEGGGAAAGGGGAEGGGAEASGGGAEGGA